MANRILDLLPANIFSDKNATFLDPVCKSGVFLREIAKRLNVGLVPVTWLSHLTMDCRAPFRCATN
jgi:site-specific DNA-methyltransferase (adenine-specific)